MFPVLKTSECVKTVSLQPCPAPSQEEIQTSGEILCTVTMVYVKVFIIPGVCKIDHSNLRFYSKENVIIQKRYNVKS